MKKTIVSIVLSVVLAISLAWAQDFFPNIIVKGAPWYDIRAYSSLGAAVTAIGASGKTLLVYGNVPVSTSTNLSTIPVVVLGSGTFTVSAGQTLTIGSITAGSDTIFLGAGTVAPTKYAVKAEWFGGLSTAITMIGATSCKVEIGSNQAISTSTASPATMSLGFVGEGRVTVSSGQTFTANGPLDAIIPKQIFYGDGAFVPPANQPLYSDWWPSFAKAVADIGSNVRQLYVVSAEVVSGNLTVPATLTVIMMPGGFINPAGATTTTLNGLFIAGLYQVFNGAGTVLFGSTTELVRPEWWAVNTTPGTTLMTTALQAALGSGAKKIKGISGVIYLTGKLGSFSNDMDIEDLHIKSSEQIAEADGQTILTLSGTVHLKNVGIDFNSFGQTGILITGDNSTVDNLYGYDFLGTAVTGGDSRSLLIITGDHCQVTNIRAWNMLQGTATNGSIPRLISLQGFCHGARLSGLYASVAADLVVTAAHDWIISDFYAEDLTDNGFYILPGTSSSDGYTNGVITNGTLIRVPETVVFSGSKRVTYSNTREFNCTIGIGVQGSTSPGLDVEDITIDGIDSDYDSSATAGHAFIRTRTGNVKTNNIIIKNCKHKHLHAYSVIALNLGVNDNWVFENNYFESHWHAGSHNKYLIDWAEVAVGDTTRFTFRGNTFKVVDDTGAITSSEYFTSRLPVNPSKLSIWENNRVLTEGSHHIRRYLRMLPNIFIRGGYFASSAEFFQEDNYITSGRPGGWGARKRVYGTAAPTVGTWDIGDVVDNAATSALGSASFWQCYQGGTLGTLSGVTANTTASSATITVNSATSLRIGQYISIAGVTGTKKILELSGTTLTVDSVCDASVTGGAVAWVAPLFETGITVRGTPSAGQVIKWNAGGYAEWAADAT